MGRHPAVLAVARRGLDHNRIMIASSPIQNEFRVTSGRLPSSGHKASSRESGAVVRSNLVSLALLALLLE